MKLSFQMFLIALLLIVVEKIKADQLPPRQAPSCEFLSNKIYCFGGDVKGSVEEYTFNSLDIYKNNNGPIQNLNSEWNTVTPKNPSNITIGRREYPQAAILPDGDSYLIQGGYNHIGSMDLHQTIIYNAKTNTLQAGANYNDTRNGGDRQIYYGVGIYIPNLNGVGLYGGFQEYVTPGSNYTAPTGEPFPGLTFNNSEGIINSYAGFYHFTLYDINSNTFSTPLQYNVPREYRTFPSGFLHTKTKKIFYFGGAINVPKYQLSDPTFLNYAMTYNTMNGQWLNEKTNGNFPSARKLHTTTLLSSGDDALLYGGTKTGTEAVMDYCYTLNIPSMTWLYHDLTDPVGTSGPRSHHAAVLVNKTSLFILFGIDRNGNSISDLLLLDVRNPKRVNFVTQFPFDNISPSADSNNTNNNDGEIKASTGIGAGAIAGITVGVIVAIAIAILAFVYLYRKKKKNNVTQVDWDKFDDQYREVISSQLQQPISGYQNPSSKSPSKGSDNSVPVPNNTLTKVINKDASEPNIIPPDISASFKPNSTQLNIIPPDIAANFKPDSTHHNQLSEIPSNITKSDILPTTIVPDGASSSVFGSVKPHFDDH